jgi:hypothetical protein
VVLGVGVVSGMATQSLMSGRLLVLDHKSLFSYGAAWPPGDALRAAAYLLLTLAYPGVKFVKDVLLSALVVAVARGSVDQAS